MLNTLYQISEKISRMRMRKKKNGEKRIENLSALYIKNDGQKIDTDSIFDSDKPLRIEIGCGKGDFITGISQSEPDFNYIAIEKIADVIMSAAEKYATSRGLGSLGSNGGWNASDGKNYDGVQWDIPMSERGNVRFICGDAKEILSRIDDSTVDSIYTNFSDPWPKKGYVSRRLTHPDFLKEYSRILKAGGMLKLKTDNEVFFDYSVESLTESVFEITEMTRDIESSSLALGNVETEYERNFKSQGIKIKALRAVNKK